MPLDIYAWKIKWIQKKQAAKGILNNEYDSIVTSPLPELKYETDWINSYTLIRTKPNQHLPLHVG